MPLPASPLSAAYARLSEVYPGLTVRQLGAAEPAPRGGGWLSAASLAQGGTALDAHLARDDAQVLRDYGQRARPDVIATFGLHRYSWAACLLITVPWFLHRRVPRLPVTHVSYDRTDGGMRLAIRPPASLACPATRRQHCPAPGWSRTRTRCGLRCARRSPSTTNRSSPPSARARDAADAPCGAW